MVLFGIRSEPRLCEEVHLNLACRWFCRLDLADRVPPAGRARGAHPEPCFRGPARHPATDRGDQPLPKIL